jgi:multicomponent Na+:H+ antiporter subunit G
VTPQSLLPWVSDALILLGTVVMTIGVIGVFRMPNVYTKLHAASQSVFLGVCSLLVGVSASGDPAIIARAALIGLLLILTTPIAAHELAKAVAQQRGVPERFGATRSGRPE